LANLHKDNAGLCEQSRNINKKLDDLKRELSGIERKLDGMTTSWYHSAGIESGGRSHQQDCDFISVGIR
jgi:hypothetical protein